jgi:hypothetical protein
MTVEDSHRQLARRFEKINWGLCSVSVAGLAILWPDHLVGGLLGAALNCLNVRLILRLADRVIGAGERGKAAAAVLLGGKSLAVLACVGGLVYLRPELGLGIAVGFGSLLPATLGLAMVASWQSLAPEEE